MYLMERNFIGIIFITLVSCCINAPQKIVEIEKQYICFDGVVVDDPKDCRIQLQENTDVYVSSAPKTSAGNISWSCSKETPYIASRTGKTYHILNCSFAKRISADKAICFKTREEAEGLGYTPCKTCGKKMKLSP